MRIPPPLPAGGRFVALAFGLVLIALVPAGASRAATDCSAEPLAEALRERMKGEGKSDAEIGEILASGFKRRILQGRIADRSGCSETQVDEALQRLEAATRS